MYTISAVSLGPNCPVTSPGIAAFVLRQLHGLMPEAYHPPTSKLIAQAAAGALAHARAGLTIIDADAVREKPQPPD